MTMKIILSGFGGQGVLSAGLLMAEAAMEEGWNSTFFPSYGAEMRGGTANCHVIISDENIASPVVAQADVLIALNKPSLDKFLPAVKEDGIVIVNSSIVREKIDAGTRKLVSIPLEEIAHEKVGNKKTANVVTIGAFVKITQTLKLDNIKKSIVNKFGAKGEKIVDLNYKALDLGFHSV